MLERHSHHPEALGALSYAAICEPGKRPHNEDCIGIVLAEHATSFLVADGMGGSRGGALASKIAVSCLEEHLKNTESASEQALVAACAQANQLIHEEAEQDPALAGMGTTLAAATFAGTKLFLTHTGDSRIYLLRNRTLTCLTEDHTVVTELLRAGTLTAEQARNHPAAHVLTRSLGPSSRAEIDCRCFEAGPARGDVYVVCSDGFYGSLSDSQIAAALDRPNLGEGLDELLRLALESKNQDNISAIAIRVGEGYPIGPGDLEPEARDPRNFSRRVQGVLLPEISRQQYRQKDSADSGPEETRDSTGRGSISAFSSGSGINTAELFRLPRLSIILTGISLGMLVGISTVAVMGRDGWSSDREREFFLPTAVPASSSTAPGIKVSPRREPRKLPSNFGIFERERISRWMSLVDSNDPVALEAARNEARELRGNLTRDIDDLDSRIETTTRRLAVWANRQQVLDSEQILTLAADIAGTSIEVRQAKDAFERTTFDYLKESEALRFDPNNSALEKRVQALAAARKEKLAALDASVKSVTAAAAREFERQITELTLDRERLREQRRVVDEELELIGVLETADDARRVKLREQLAERLARSTAEPS